MSGVVAWWKRVLMCLKNERKRKMMNVMVGIPHLLLETALFLYPTLAVLQSGGRGRVSIRSGLGLRTM